MLSPVLSHLAGLGADVAQPADAGPAWLVTGQIPAALVPEFTRALPGLTRGEGSWWSHPAGDRPVRRPIPVRARTDGNPLDREEYLRFTTRSARRPPGRPVRQRPEWLLQMDGVSCSQLA